MVGGEGMNQIILEVEVLEEEMAGDEEKEEVILTEGVDFHMVEAEVEDLMRFEAGATVEDFK